MVPPQYIFAEDFCGGLAVVCQGKWTIEKLLGKHSSRPFNPTLAGCVYLTGKIETWGRGVRKVFDECKKHGCPPPVYEVSTGDPGDIQVCINAAPDAIVDSDSRGANVETINETIKSNPGISMIQLATLLGKSRATIARGISSLVRGKRIEHRGSNKTGGYYAL